MPKKLNKTVSIKIRLTENEATFLKNTAEVYADGNISKWIRYCFMNYEPKFLKKKEKATKK